MFSTIRVILVLGALGLTMASCAFMGEVGPGTLEDASSIGDTMLSLEAQGDIDSSSDDPSLWFASDTQGPAASVYGGMESRAVIANTIDDQGTSDDPSDDVVTIVRQGRHWSGFGLVRVMERGRRPTADLSWDAWWNGDSAKTQTATEYWYESEDAALADSTRTPDANNAVVTVDIEITWLKSGSEVSMTSMQRTGERLALRASGAMVVNSTYTWTLGQMASRVTSFYQDSVAPGNLVYTENATIDGETRTVVRTNAQDEVIAKKVSTSVETSGSITWTVTMYRGPQEIKRWESERTMNLDGSGWTGSRTVYRLDGSVKRSTTETCTLVVDGDTRTITRTISSNATTKTLVLAITTTPTGYTLVETLANGEVRTWTAQQNADGSWTIENMAGDTFIVEEV